MRVAGGCRRGRDGAEMQLLANETHPAVEGDGIGIPPGSVWRISAG